MGMTCSFLNILFYWSGSQGTRCDEEDEAGVTFQVLQGDLLIYIYIYIGHIIRIESAQHAGVEAAQPPSWEPLDGSHVLGI